MSNLSENDLTAMFNRSNTELVAEEQPEVETTEETNKTKRGTTFPVRTTRNIIVVGCGDGGCNIATAITRAAPKNVYTIDYNSTNRTMEGQVGHVKLWPKGKDGAGKFRMESKETFKETAMHMKIYDAVDEAIQIGEPRSYILITTTTDGGTGSGISPNVAGFLQDNFNIPVIMVGVLPETDNGDGMSQQNALSWMREMEKNSVPTLLFDNNLCKQSAGESLEKAHDRINSYIADVAKLIVGQQFGNSNISIIDDQNLLMLMSRLGGRIVAAVEDYEPDMDETLDQCIEKMLSRNYQPKPSDVRGIGVFIRGPKSFLNRMNTSIPEIQKTYGNAVLKFDHIEETEDGETPRIGVILTGCSEPEDRIRALRKRYDFINSKPVKKGGTIIGDMAASLVNPLEGEKKEKRGRNALDLSSLDL